MKPEIKLIMFTIGTLFIISIIALSFTTNYEIVCTKSDEITAVGGCDHNGWCGVMTKQYGKQHLYRPVVGEHTCLKLENRKKE